VGGTRKKIGRDALKGEGTGRRVGGAEARRVEGEEPEGGGRREEGGRRREEGGRRRRREEGGGRREGEKNYLTPDSDKIWPQ
jgi:hypothetical protein